MFDEHHVLPSSLCDRRQQNIQRNQDFLKKLLAEVDDSNPIIVPNDDRKENSEQIFSFIGRDHLCLGNGILLHEPEMISRFNHRQTQISAIYHYLQRFAYKRLAVRHFSNLFVYGGSGKSVITKAILDIESIPYVHISCSKFNAFKDLVQSIHFQVCIQLDFVLRSECYGSRVSSGLLNMPSSTIHELGSMFMEASKFLDLCGCYRFVIVLDDFDAVASFLECDALTQLVGLFDVESAISFIAIVPSITQLDQDIACKGVLINIPHRIFFTPYNEKQLEDIVIDAFFQELVQSIDSQYQNLETMKRDLFNKVMEIIRFICQHAMPVITLHFKGIDAIMRCVHSIWKLLYCDSPRKYCGRLLSLMYSNEEVFICESTILSPINSRNSVTVQDRCNYMLQIPKVSAIKAAIEDLLKSNTINVKLTTSNSEGKVGEIKLDLFQTHTLPENDIGRHHYYHAAAIPLRTRCLMIASYLAAHNPKDSDNLKFIGEGTRKRKSSEMKNGHDSNEISSASGKYVSANKSFSLERLMSIYGQVLKICTSEHLDALYGDVNIQVMIHSLVEIKLLGKCPATKLSRAMFSSNISRSLAENISKSIHFPLSQFVVQYYAQSI